MKLQPCWYNKVYNRVLINSLRGLDSCFVILRRSGSTNAARVVKQAPGCHSEEHSDEESVSSAYRFLTALRLSLSSLLGRVRKRPLRSLRSSIRFARHHIGGRSIRAEALRGEYLPPQGFSMQNQFCIVSRHTVSGSVLTTAISCDTGAMRRSICVSPQYFSCVSRSARLAFSWSLPGPQSTL